MSTIPSARRLTLPSRSQIPLNLYWTAPEGIRPIPRRVIQFRNRRPSAESLSVFNPAFRYMTASRGEPFDFSASMRRLCEDLVSRCPELHHIDLQRVIIGVTQARSTRRHGLQAKVTPMRFHNGDLTRRRRGRAYQVQRYWIDGIEVLYLLTFCLPRFLDQSFDEKLITIFHELYHVAPEFNGDLRRHSGRYCFHTRSQKDLDQQMAAQARDYLNRGPDPSLYAFLRLSFTELQTWHTTIYGFAPPVPKLIPLE